VKLRVSCMLRETRKQGLQARRAPAEKGFAEKKKKNEAE